MGKITPFYFRNGLIAIALAATVTSQAEIKFNAVASYPTHSAGVYSFTTDKYSPVLIKNNVFASGGGVAYDNGYFYGTRVETVMGLTAVQQNSYDMNNGWEIDDNYSGSVENVATAITFDRDLGLTFGCYFNSDGETFRFCSVNVPYFSATTIANLPKGWGACGFNKNGVLYAIDEDGDLLTVDTTYGTLTKVGETGLKNDWITGGMVDKESNTMLYAIKTDTESALYSIDLATAAATKLYDLENEEQLGGFFVPEPEYAGNLPGKSTYSPSLSVSGTNLNGTFAFYAPNYSIDSSIGSGDLTYNVYINGELYKTGASAYKGGRISVPFEVEKSGYYCLSVSFSNEFGEGPRQRADVKYMGIDVPKAPTAPVISAYTDGEVSLRWSGVSSGVHGGQIDRTNMVYRVTRYPEGIVVSAPDLKTTSMKDALPSPATRTDYWYTIEAVTGDMVSMPVTTAKFALGAVEPPYIFKFEQATDFFEFSTLNPGNDTQKWSYNSSDKCIYVRTSSKPADNWLILPVVNVKNGMTYAFTMAAKAYNSSYTEQFEVFAGNAPTVEALTQPVVASTSVSDSQYTEFEGAFSADTDGTYYIGIHATTPSNGGYLYINSMSIGAGKTDKAPATVTDLAGTADETGAHKATFTFTVPSTDMAGNAIDAVTKVELTRDGEVVKTITAGIPAPGETMTIVDDTDPAAGDHVYGIITYNSFGDSAEAKINLFIGFATPTNVTEVKMTETTEGHVVAKWTAVTADIKGQTLTADDVTYNVYEYIGGDIYLLAENVKGNTYEYDAFDGFTNHDGSQRFVQTIVEAVTEGGTSKKVPSAQTPVGKAYTTPWAESFADCKVSSIFANQVVKGDDVWSMVASDDFGTTPYDNDGGMMYFEAYGGGACSLITGKISLDETVEPAFIFYVYNYASSSRNENIVEVDARIMGEDYVQVYQSDIADMGELGQWCKVTIPLNDFEGQTIQLRITANNKTIAFTHLDNFKVTSNAQYNLAVATMTAPVSVAPNTEFTIGATIENLGWESARGYRVNLLRDDEVIAVKSGLPALDSNAVTNIEFTDCLSALMVGEHTYTVEIEYGPDQFVNDNSKSATVVVESNAFATVNDLQVTQTADNVTLTWSVPEAPSMSVAQTESFDGISAWATSIPGWKFVDNDHATIGGIGNKQLPVSGQQSFFVFNNTLPALQTGNIAAFSAHSGNQYLCAMYSLIGKQEVQNDDWAISPELSGEPQTISMWASSFPCDPDQPQYYETFQILYSTTGNNPEDFTLIREYVNIPQQWIEYSAYLPEGTKYFAIRCVSPCQYMLFVDDVTFIAKNAATNTMQVTGYNVYRDNVKLNDEPVEVTTYTDADVDNNSVYKYNVTALYAEGESLKSNDVQVDRSTSSVDAVMASSLRIYTIAGSVVVDGAEGLDISIVTPDGKTIRTVKGETRTVITLSTGMYIVKAGDTVAKVTVK